MEMTGRIIAEVEARSGTSKNGTWTIKPYVLEEQEGQYPKKVCFEVFGDDKIKQFDIKVGEYYKISFDIDAREYQGRWYNTIRAWKVESASAPAAPQQVSQPQPTAPVDLTPTNNDGKLPF